MSWDFQFLRDISHESLVFTIHNFKCQFFRDVSHDSFVLKDSVLIFWSLARKLRFHILNFQFLREVSYEIAASCGNELLLFFHSWYYKLQHRNFCPLSCQDPALEQVLCQRRAGSEELRWAEMSWDKLRRADISRDELRRCGKELRWEGRPDMRRALKRWEQLSWDKLRRVEKLTRAKRGRVQKEKKRWENLRWHEKKMEHLRSTEKSWDELRRTEKRGKGVRWDETRRTEVKNIEGTAWDEMRWDWTRWGEMRWDEPTWEEIRWLEEMRSQKICHRNEMSGHFKRFVLRSTECLPTPYRRILCSAL